VALKLDGKRVLVEDINKHALLAMSAVIADYRGLGVSQMTELRSKARASGVYLKVVRNTLARRGVQETEYECLSDSGVGPSLLAFSLNDPGAAARLFKDFAKDNEKFEVRALAVGGSVYGKEDIDMLAKLPTKDQAISMLMSVMQAPIAKLVRTINEVPTKLVRVLAAVKEQKEAA
jgi:large subunit ribosomal protein L10